MAFTHRLSKIALGIFALFALPVVANGQNIVTGQETTVTYTGTNATLAQPGTPANNFISPNGTNTFLIPIAQPAVSVRIYITNGTVNACNGAFTLQMFASSDVQTSSFNNSLSNWQALSLQNIDGTLVTITSPNIPASGVASVASTAVASPRIAVQLVNQNVLACPSTTVEVTATITPIALTSPLISNFSGTSNNGVLNQIQGIVPNGGNGATVNPVVSGGLANPINGSFLNQGLDNFGATTVVNGAGPYNRGTVPRPSGTGEWAIAFMSPASDSTSAFVGANSGWGCIGISTAGGCANGAAGLTAAVLPNVSPNTPLIQTNVTPLSVNVPTIFAVFKNTPVIGVHSSTGNSGGAVAVGSPAAGSVTMVFFTCTQNPGQSFPCVTSVTSSTGLLYKSVISVQGDPTKAAPGATLFMATNLATGGAETITPVLGNLTTNVTFYYIALSGLNAAALNQPNLPNQADGLGNEVVRLDAQAPNQFSCSVTLSTNTTTVCQAAATNINGVPVRNYVTDYQIQTTIAGTATNISIVTGTGTNCATTLTNLSAILYPNTTVGLQSILGARTPLVSPLQSQVCVTQAGTTAGTSTVEIRGFQAP